MPNPNPNQSGLRPWQKGISGNPGGRPRSILTNLKVSSIVGRLWDLPQRDVAALAEDDSAPLGDRIVAVIMLRTARDGDAHRLNMLLDRAIGRVKDASEQPERDPLDDMTPEERAAQIDELLRKRASGSDSAPPKVSTIR